MNIFTQRKNFTGGGKNSQQNCFSLTRNLNKTFFIRLFIIAAFSIILSGLYTQPVKADQTGDGSATNPYLVSSFDDLKLYLEKGVEYWENANPAYVKLMADIEVPSGGDNYISVYDSTYGECYEGGIDLNGHVLDLSGSTTQFLYIADGKKFTISDSNPTSDHGNSYTFDSVTPITGGIICNYENYDSTCIYAGVDELYMTGGTFYNFKITDDAMTSSVCIDWDEYGSAYFSNVNFVKNQKPEYWGGVFWIKEYMNAEFYNCIFCGNYGAYGGAINTGGNTRIDSCKFFNNNSDLFGVISLESNYLGENRTLYMKDTQIYSNYCQPKSEEESAAGVVVESGKWNIILDGTVMICYNGYLPYGGTDFLVADFGLDPYADAVISFGESFDTTSKIGLTSAPSLYSGESVRVTSGGAINIDNFYSNSEDYFLEVKEGSIYLTAFNEYCVYFYSAEDYDSAYSTPEEQWIKEGNKVTKPATDPVSQDPEYKFLYWACNGEEWDFENDIVEVDIDLEPIFAPSINVFLTSESTETGTVSAIIDGVTISAEDLADIYIFSTDEITLVATPASGYVFKEWNVTSENATISNNVFTVSTTDDIYITGIFEEAPTPTPPTPTPEPDPDPVVPSDDKAKKVEQDVYEVERTDKDSEAPRITQETVNDILESGAKEVILGDNEKSVTEQGQENKEAADEAKKLGQEIKNETKGSDAASVTLDSGLLDTMINAEASKVKNITVRTRVADVKFDKAAINAILANAGDSDTIELIVEQTKEEIAKSKNDATKVHFELSLVNSAGKKISDFNGGNVDVKVPVPKAMQDKKIVCVYHDGKNHYTLVEGYKNSDGTYTFTTHHFSEYILMTQDEYNNLNTKVTDFSTLKARATDKTESSITLTWNKYNEADGYIIYGSLCNHDGENHKLERIATINSADTTSYTVDELEAGTFYKFRVKAYKKINLKKVVTVRSLLLHVSTLGGEYGSSDGITIKAIGNELITKQKQTTKLTLKKGTTATIDATDYCLDSTIKRHVGLRYESSNSNIATVSKTGEITGLKKGTCYIYVISESGKYRRIKVTVKK